MKLRTKTRNSVQNDAAIVADPGETTPKSSQREVVVLPSTLSQQQISMIADENLMAANVSATSSAKPKIILVSSSGDSAFVTRTINDTTPCKKATNGLTVLKSMPDRTIVLSSENLPSKVSACGPSGGAAGSALQQSSANQNQVVIRTLQNVVDSNGAMVLFETSDGSEENVEPLLTSVSDPEHRNESISYQYVADQASTVDMYTGNPIVSHNQLQYGVYTSDPNSVQQYPYYAPGQIVSGSQFVSNQNLVHQTNPLYVQQPTGNSSSQQSSPSDDEEGGHHLSHTTRASPATIQWLLQNYETAEGVSLPRCTLYTHYLRHCADNKLDPVNAASFGKLIRSVFLGLRTRRLGTRGNSKYHYYGIRIKPDSPLNRVSEDQMASMQMARRQEPQSRGSKYNMTKVQQQIHQPSVIQNLPANQNEPSVIVGPSANSSNNSMGSQSDLNKQNNNRQQSASATTTTSAAPEPVNSVNVAPVSASGNHASTEEEEQFREYLGAGGVPEIPFPPSDKCKLEVLSVGLEPEYVVNFCDAYRAHCAQLLEFVQRLKFAEVDVVWRQFWQPVEQLCDDQHQSHSHPTSGLTWMQFYMLCNCACIQEFVRDTDLQFYQSLVSVLIPNVLRPIPSRLLQNIRNFAKGSESNLANAVVGVPEGISKIKLRAVAAFAQTLRRYTSLNHLAQAARGVLQNQPQVQQMLSDLNRVNFKDVQEQASWVCVCDSSVVESIETDFKATLEKQRTLEEWAQWLMGVVDRVLRPGQHQSIGSFIESARQFLLKWSFYSSMVIRDLTLRSAASFGSFHLIRLLYDEYMYYLVEHRIAQATGQTAIAVMSQSSRFLCPQIGDAMASSMLSSVVTEGVCALSQNPETAFERSTNPLSFEPVADEFSQQHNVENVYCNGVRERETIVLEDTAGVTTTSVEAELQKSMQSNSQQQSSNSKILFLSAIADETFAAEMPELKRPKLHL